MHSLLLVDDDREMLDITAASLRDAGYKTLTAENSHAAVRVLEKESVACIILDVMMPGTDGFALCAKIREQSTVPIIFLTGRVSEDDKVKGLLLGADDYMEKPFSFRELEARVQTAIRHSAAVVPDTLSFPPLEIDIIAHRAYCNGNDLYLTSREFGLLYMLATSDGAVVTYEDIGMHMWNSYREEDRRSVMVSISRLRKKLEDNPVTARMIETVWTTGYKFTAKQTGR